MTDDKLWLVFDVESVGLHGEGFAVGWVVWDQKRGYVADGYVACDPDAANGTEEAREWVRANVKVKPDRADPRGVRDFFWTVWRDWAAEGAVLAADVAWPVEARFLADCISDVPTEREWLGPYPLIDIASVRLAAGFDPLGTYDRLPNELPEHNPLNDARQSMRLLLEALTAGPSSSSEPGASDD